MSSWDEDREHLLCQDCGERIRRLTREEQKEITYNPYNFVAYCVRCWPERFKQLAGGRMLS